MRMMNVVMAAVVASAVGLGGCDMLSSKGSGAGADTASAHAAASGAPASPTPATTATTATTATPPDAGADGVRFDPDNLVTGQRLGDVTVANATLMQATALPNKPYAGRVRFSGTLDLTGRLVANADASHAPCFEPDAASVTRLPRMRGDTRPVRVCFQPEQPAAEMIGSMAPPASVSITVSDYVSSYSYMGVSNTAALKAITSGSAH
jgi:hypothetical protein